MTDYLKSFVIGSSLPVFLHFFLSVQQIEKGTKNYTYAEYTIIAPIYLGLMNMLSLYLGTRFNWSLHKRLLVTSILSILIVNTATRLSNSYNFSDTEWLRYTVRVSLMHLFTFNIVLYGLEKNLTTHGLII